MKATTLAKFEGFFREFITSKFPKKFVISQYSKGRRKFIEELDKDIPKEFYNPHPILSKKLWGIKFRSPIMNAAGMFKNGECFETVFKQGAGAYLGGTGTWNPREGSKILGIKQPFVPYPRSHSSSNNLALPNNGDLENAGKFRHELNGTNGFPIGWSLMASPDFKGEEKLEHLVLGMRLFEESGIDFLELNVSCPNTEHDDKYDKFENVLKYVSNNFLERRTRNLPVIVKFSNDTDLKDVKYIIHLLSYLKFDGVNFGNTSKDYKKHRDFIHPNERKLYDFFTKNFRGGISGRPLKKKSLDLASRAVKYVREERPSQEFHVIRTGGIETLEDIRKSEDAGISLNQWFTGYFDGFDRNSHEVYRGLFENR